MKKFEEIGKVYVTKDYEQFKFMKKNRKINWNHVARIAKKMREEFFVTIALIEVIDGMLYIRDGQHRLKSCQIENKPYYFTIVNEIDVDCEEANPNTLASLQSTQKWVPADRANFFAESGHPEYQKFMKFMEKTGMSATAAFIALTGKNTVTVGQKFRDGIFKIEDEERAYVFAKIIQGFVVRGMNRSATNPKFVSAVFRGLMRRTIDIKKLYKKCEKGEWRPWIGNGTGQTLANLKLSSYVDRGNEEKKIVIENEGWNYSYEQL